MTVYSALLQSCSATEKEKWSFLNFPCKHSPHQKTIFQFSAHNFASLVTRNVSIITKLDLFQPSFSFRWPQTVYRHTNLILGLNLAERGEQSEKTEIALTGRDLRFLHILPLLLSKEEICKLSSSKQDIHLTCNKNDNTSSHFLSFPTSIRRSLHVPCPVQCLYL